MLYGEVDNRLREGETAAIAPLPASSLGERWSAAVDAQIKAYNLNSDWAVKEAEFDAASDGIFGITGVRLANPFRDGLAEDLSPEAIERRTGRNPVTVFESEIERLAREKPDKAREILSFGRVLERAYAKRNAAVARLEDVTQRSPYAVNMPVLGPVDPAAVAGGLYGSLGDPATLAVNAVGAVGKGGTLLYHFVRSALINAGAEVVQQPFIKAWANEAGDPYGWDDAARGVAAAALLGGALDTTVRGTYRGVQRARGLEPVREDGLITGWRSPAEKEAALDAAAARLPEDNPVRRLAEGDVAAAREVAEATGAIEDPAVRGAIMAREMADDLDGPPPMAIDGGEGMLSLAQALRHATDPDEPPPATLASLSKRSVLEGLREQGFNIERVLFHGTPAGKFERLRPSNGDEPWIFLTPDTELARRYGEPIEVVVRGELLEVPSLHGKWPHGLKKEAAAEVQKAGYSGVFAREENEVVIFNPEDTFITRGSESSGEAAWLVAAREALEQTGDIGAAARRIEESQDLSGSDKMLAVSELLRSRHRKASLSRDQRLAAAAEAIERADQVTTHGAVLGARATVDRASPAPRLDDVAGADGKLQADRLERDLASAIERATKPEKQPAAAAGDAPLSAADLAIAEGRYVHSQAATLRMAEIRDGLARTAKMLPKNIRLRVVDRLSLGGQDLDGAWNYHDRIVYAALSAADPVHTSRHETIHALRQTGLMSDAEFDTLYRFAEEGGLRQAYGIDGEYAKLYRKLYGEHGDAYVEALLREETIAEMFADYSARGKRFGAEFGKVGRAVDKIIDVIDRFLMEVRRMLKGYDVTSVRDVFEAIETGAMARRGQRVSMPGGAVIEGFHLFSIRAFHGTPHTFAPEEGAPAGRFRASQIGTGEGAQAYGHGLYFAGNEDTARWYRDALADPADTPEAIALGKLDTFKGDRERASKSLEKFVRPLQEGTSPDVDAYFKALRLLQGSDEIRMPANAGRMYEVRINAEPEQFLDWDKPLREQSDKVRGLAETMAAEWKARDADLRSLGLEVSPPTGEALLGALSADGAAAARALREAGIAGVRYLDRNSRHAGEGTSNFVIFPGNEHLIEIVAVDGQPVVNLAQDLADVKRDNGLGKLVEACRL